MNADLKSKDSLNVIDAILIVSLNVDLDESSLISVQESVLNALAHRSIRGVVLNFSEVEIMDSFLIGKLEEIAKMIELMGARAVVAGLRPEIIVSLVTLNINPQSLITALNLESAFKLLKKLFLESIEEEGEEDEENMDSELTDDNDEERS